MKNGSDLFEKRDSPYTKNGTKRKKQSALKEIDKKRAEETVPNLYICVHIIL